MSALDKLQERIEKVGLGRLTLLLLAVGISASPIGAIVGVAGGPVIGPAVGNIIAGTCLVGLAGCGGAGAVRGATWAARKIEGSLLWAAAKAVGRGLVKAWGACARAAERLADKLLPAQAAPGTPEPPAPANPFSAEDRDDEIEALENEIEALREQLAERDAVIEDYERRTMDKPTAQLEAVKSLDPEVAAKVALWSEMAAFARENDPAQGNGVAQRAGQADLDWLYSIDQHGEWVHDEDEVRARWPRVEVLVQHKDDAEGFTTAALIAGKRRCDEFRTEPAAIAFANKDFGYLELKEFDAAMSGDLEVLKSLPDHEAATVRAAAYEMRDTVIDDGRTVAQAWEKAGSPLAAPGPEAIPEHGNEEVPR